LAPAALYPAPAVAEFWARAKPKARWV